MARKGTRKRSRKSGGLLTHEQQRDLLGVGLLALAVFVAASLFPTNWLGARGEAWFPTGNVVGSVGVRLRAVLVGGFGVASPLAALLLAVGDSARGSG
jgi:hypothetical protein